MSLQFLSRQLHPLAPPSQHPSRYQPVIVRLVLYKSTEQRVIEHKKGNVDSQSGIQLRGHSCTSNVASIANRGAIFILCTIEPTNRYRIESGALENKKAIPKIEKNNGTQLEINKVYII